ncbi:zinc finger BED domain-containing protein RICESLEEPER 1-like [Dorcoceras hygrometricum]|uniref:Zinc finger BED domain-containing protein RICESLEEPER 1-like n=1 Tax=Dorcoceras hygrometricum TaxID=472368 RepID=A0A2Z6ZVS9_9LAMI|nr:zinc finger BED domain-containing protein RICESLEEPER 1-like [Dorcoceras hygrometricum]
MKILSTTDHIKFLYPVPQLLFMLTLYSKRSKLLFPWFHGWTLTVHAIDSRVKSMDFRLGSLDSKVEQLLNVQTFLKHDFGIYKHGFYDRMEMVAANINSSQKSLETNLVRQLTEQQYQFANDLDFVKMQLVELVNHLKETGDDKKGEGGQSRGSEGGQRSSIQGEGPSSTMGKGPNYKRGERSSGYKRRRWF